MKPSRELDALVAEKVMGGKVTQLRDYVQWPPMRGFLPIPNYSEDIGAAWEVVEKLKISIAPPGSVYADGEYGNSSDDWDCEVKKQNAKEWSDSVSGRAKTAPHAICLAALKAVGVEAE